MGCEERKSKNGKTIKNAEWEGKEIRVHVRWDLWLRPSGLVPLEPAQDAKKQKQNSTTRGSRTNFKPVSIFLLLGSLPRAHIASYSRPKTNNFLHYSNTTILGSMSKLKQF